MFHQGVKGRHRLHHRVTKSPKQQLYHPHMTFSRVDKNHKQPQEFLGRLTRPSFGYTVINALMRPVDNVRPTASTSRTSSLGILAKKSSKNSSPIFWETITNFSPRQGITDHKIKPVKQTKGKSLTDL